MDAELSWTARKIFALLANARHFGAVRNAVYDQTAHRALCKVSSFFDKLLEQLFVVVRPLNGVEVVFAVDLAWVVLKGACNAISTLASHAIYRFKLFLSYDYTP